MTVDRRAWIGLVYFFLLVLGIPWYWPADTTVIVFGLPIWVLVAILFSLATSIFTAFLLLRYSWKTESDLGEPGNLS